MRVLCIGDIHEPVSHPGYLAFCADLRKKHKCDQVVFIGDVVDWHAVSFHAHHPDAPGPKDEFELAHIGVQKWVNVFPTARVCIGNHDERVIRLAESVNIPARFLRSYKDIWTTPGWTWGVGHTLDEVFYFHGTGTGGIHPAFNSMCKHMMSVAQGHIHSAAGIKWRANPTRRTFGMDTGCGVDDQAAAFAYGHHNQIRSILSACVVLDGIPIHEIMPCGPGERFHRSNFGTNSFGGFDHEDAVIVPGSFPGVSDRPDRMPTQPRRGRGAKAKPGRSSQGKGNVRSGSRKG